MDAEEMYLKFTDLFPYIAKDVIDYALEAPMMLRIKLKTRIQLIFIYSDDDHFTLSEKTKEYV